MQVAQITLPIFLARCDTILKAYAAVIRAGKDGLDAMQTDELLCVLEILATMSISSAVADAALEGRRHLQVSKHSAGGTCCHLVSQHVNYIKKQHVCHGSSRLALHLMLHHMLQITTQCEPVDGILLICCICTMLLLYPALALLKCCS